jgi:hypothetical protein
MRSESSRQPGVFNSVDANDENPRRSCRYSPFVLFRAVVKRRLLSDAHRTRHALLAGCLRECLTASALPPSTARASDGKNHIVTGQMELLFTSKYPNK